MAWPRWFGLGLLILTTASNARAAGPAAKTWCSEERAAVGKELLTVLTCKPVPSYLIIPYLWTPVSIVIACPSSSFNVYTASSRDQLAEKVAAGASTWCGLTSLADPKSCSLELSAFQQSYVAVRPTRGGATAGCTTKSHASVSFAMIAAVALGAALFYGASPLSTNVAFRISAGTLLFMSGSLVLLAFLLFRVTPHKRVVATVAAALGSTGSFLLRWMYGRWLPFAAQLTSNPWFAAYLGVSAVVGATVTYLMDDTANPKVNNVLRLGLRLGGLLLVFNGTWTQPGMAAAAVALLLLSVALPVVRGWARVV